MIPLALGGCGAAPGIALGISIIASGSTLAKNEFNCALSDLGACVAPTVRSPIPEIATPAVVSPADEGGRIGSAVASGVATTKAFLVAHCLSYGAVRARWSVRMAVWISAKAKATAEFGDKFCADVALHAASVDPGADAAWLGTVSGQLLQEAERL